MSHNLPGNPYADDAAAAMADGDMTTAIADATLALAYEQRTTTLLQFLMWEPSDNYVSNYGAAELQAQIVARLGLNGDQK